MFTKEHYIQYSMSTSVNDTCTYLADHLEGTSHDAINDYLRRGRVTARDLWALAADASPPLIPPSKLSLEIMEIKWFDYNCG